MILLIVLSAWQVQEVLMGYREYCSEGIVWVVSCKIIFFCCSVKSFVRIGFYKTNLLKTWTSQNERALRLSAAVYIYYIILRRFWAECDCYVLKLAVSLFICHPTNNLRSFAHWWTVIVERAMSWKICVTSVFVSNKIVIDSLSRTKLYIRKQTSQFWNQGKFADPDWEKAIISNSASTKVFSHFCGYSMCCAAWITSKTAPYGTAG